MRTQPETRARSAQEAGKRALNLWGSKANQACTEIVALAAIGPVPVAAFKKLGLGILLQFCSAQPPALQPRWRHPLSKHPTTMAAVLARLTKRPSAELRPPKVRGDTPSGQP